MYCSNCGNKIDDNDKFCRSCGNSVSNTRTEIVAENNIDTQKENTTTQPPYCTNCGKSIGSLKICPNCHLKTKKSYKKYCRYCGGIIGENKKCSDCDTSGTMTFIERVVRLILAVILAFFYILAFSLVVGGNTVAGFILFIATLLTQIFLYRKKQIHKFKTKLVNSKNKKVKFSLIYACVPFALILGFLISGMVSVSPLGNDLTTKSQAISYSQQLIRENLKNPDSLKVHSSTVLDDFSDENTNYYEVKIDYSAQNGFGGYNRKQETIYVKVFKYGGSAIQISGTEYVSKKYAK